jgi:hypothetical protein
VLMLVHSREPPPEERRERGPWEPNWRVWLWMAIAVVVGYAALNADGAVGTLLLLGAFYAVCRSVAEALPYSGGLTEWRQ